jgi:hypothetical protein
LKIAAPCNTGYLTKAKDVFVKVINIERTGLTSQPALGVLHSGLIQGFSERSAFLLYQLQAVIAFECET